MHLQLPPGVGVEDLNAFLERERGGGGGLAASTGTAASGSNSGALELTLLPESSGFEALGGGSTMAVPAATLPPPALPSAPSQHGAPAPTTTQLSAQAATQLPNRQRSLEAAAALLELPVPPMTTSPASTGGRLRVPTALRQQGEQVKTLLRQGEHQQQQRQKQCRPEGGQGLQQQAWRQQQQQQQQAMQQRSGPLSVFSAPALQLPTEPPSPILPEALLAPPAGPAPRPTPPLAASPPGLSPTASQPPSLPQSPEQRWTVFKPAGKPCHPSASTPLAVELLCRPALPSRGWPHTYCTACRFFLFHLLFTRLCWVQWTWPSACYKGCRAGCSSMRRWMRPRPNRLPCSSSGPCDSMVRLHVP